MTDRFINSNFAISIQVQHVNLSYTEFSN